eukprot:6477083-Amphidinium_carterae.2
MSYATYGSVDNATMPQGTCTSTAVESNPWWEVDLGDYYYVRSVYVVNPLGGQQKFRNCGSWGCAVV